MPILRRAECRSAKKVFGPKKQMLEHDVEATILSHVSLIYDTNLPDSELDLIRGLYFDNAFKRSGCISVILQHLFNAYGLIFENKCLLYAALALQVRQITRRGRFFGRPWHVSDSRQLICLTQFFSLVNRYLIAAIADGSISECHFFGLVLAKFASHGLALLQKSDMAAGRSEEITYERGCIEVLEHLTRRRLDMQLNNACPLKYLWDYTFSFVFRMGGSWSRRQDIWRQSHRSETYRDDLNFLPSLSRLHVISQQISYGSSASDPRIEFGITPFMKQRKLAFREWHGLYWNGVNLRNGLAACFETAFVLGTADNEHSNVIAKSAFESIRSKLAELQNLPCVSTLHELVLHFVALLIVRQDQLHPPAALSHCGYPRCSQHPIFLSNIFHGPHDEFNY